MKRFLLGLVLIFVLAFVSSCNSPALQPSPENPSVVTGGTSYPIQGVNSSTADSSQGYPAPSSPLTQSQINSLKAPDPMVSDVSMGSISGVLLNGLQSTLMGNTDIYLTKGIGDKNDIIPPVLVGSLSSRGDIPGRTQADGTFSFTNIPPGNYFMIVSMDLSPVVSSIKENSPLIIIIEKGKVNNLGVVFYTSK